MVALQEESGVLKVWLWDGTGWEVWTPPSAWGPSSTYGATMQYDPVARRVVVGKGFSMSGLATWDGREWGTQPGSTGGLGGWKWHSFWDLESNSFALLDSVGGTPGIWRYDAGAWEFEAEADEAVDNDVGFDIYDEQAGVAQNPEDFTVIRFGGFCAVGEVEGCGNCVGSQTYLWDGTDWEELDVPDPEGDGNPAARYDATLAWDPVRKTIQMVSGNCNYGGNKPGPGQVGPFEIRQWDWDGTSWAMVEMLDPEGDGSAGNPDDGWNYVQYRVGTDFERKRIFAVSHGGEKVVEEAAWQWNGTSWRRLHPADRGGDGSPDSRIDTATAYDSSRDRFVMFGGRKPSSGNLNDLWEWNPAPFERPAQVARFSGAAAGYGDNEMLEEMSLIWVAGERGMKMKYPSAA